MQTTPFPVSRKAALPAQAWRLQDAKSQFSALVDNALRGVPQHVTRRGKQAVVVLSEQDFEALQRVAANRTARPASFIDHLLAMPTESTEVSPEARSKTPAITAAKAPEKTLIKSQAKPPARQSPTRKPVGIPSLDLQPREIDWS